MCFLAKIPASRREFAARTCLRARCTVGRNRKTWSKFKFSTCFGTHDILACSSTCTAIRDVLRVRSESCKINVGSFENVKDAFRINWQGFILRWIARRKGSFIRIDPTIPVNKFVRNYRYETNGNTNSVRAFSISAHRASLRNGERDSLRELAALTPERAPFPRHPPAGTTVLGSPTQKCNMCIRRTCRE